MVIKINKNLYVASREIISYYYHWVKRILRREKNLVRQIEIDPNDCKIRILFIGPGILNIPPDGWGGVEQVMHRQIKFFREHGKYAIDLLNSQRHFDWIKMWKEKPNVVYLQYDNFAFRSRVYRYFFKIPVVGISHYGYADQEVMWDLSYYKTVKSLLKLDKIICLNNKILEKYREFKPSAKLVTIPNSIEPSKYKYVKKELDFLYLGKVEKRKRQFELANLLPDDFNISFIGPIIDERINQLSNIKQSWFKGQINQDTLNSIVPKFKVLILCSTGEGDAAVLYEGQASGLSIVATNAALGAQDKDLPWIYLTEIESSDFINTLEIARTENLLLSNNIYKYAKYHYDSKFWDIKLLNAIIDEIK